MDFNKWKIEKDSPIPYYHQLENYIKQEIDSSQLKKGELLNSEAEIARELNISISVVRETFHRLVSQGIIKRERGKRSVVICDPKRKINYIAKEISLYKDIKNLGLDFETKTMGAKIINAFGKIRDVLNVIENEKIIKLSRLRIVEKKPMIFWVSYLPSFLCKGIENIDLKNKSLHQILEDKYNLKPSYAEKTFEVRIAEKFESDLLKVPVSSSLIYLECILYLENGTPLEYYEAWQAASDWKFVFHCKQE